MLKSEQHEEISALKRELVEARVNDGLEEGEIQPLVIEEIKVIKEQMRAIKEDKKQNEAKTSSWVEVTQKKVDEAENHQHDT